MSYYEQIVPRVVLEGWPLDMLVDPVEQKQAIDFIANECKYVTTPSCIFPLGNVHVPVLFVH